MNWMIATFRSQLDAAATRNATRHLDNHLLRDIGLPERTEKRTFYSF